LDSGAHPTTVRLLSALSRSGAPAPTGTAASDFGKFQEAMESDQAAEAMKRDGVHPDTLLVLEEA
jgi:hypothetical protein